MLFESIPYFYPKGNVRQQSLTLFGQRYTMTSHVMTLYISGVEICMDAQIFPGQPVILFPNVAYV